MVFISGQGVWWWYFQGKFYARFWWLKLPVSATSPESMVEVKKYGF